MSSPVQAALAKFKVPSGTSFLKGEKMSKYMPYIVGLIFIAVLGWGIFNFSKVSDLKSANAVMGQNLAASKDTIRIYKDSNSVAYEKLAFVQADLRDSIKILTYGLQSKVKEVMSLTNIIVELKKEISSGNGDVIIIHDTVVTSLPSYQYSFSDTSGIINVIGEITIKGLNGHHELIKSIDPFRLRNLIFINKENRVSAAVQFDNPAFSVSSMETTVSWEVIPDKPVPPDTFWERLGVYANMTVFPFEDFEAGVVVRPFTFGYTIDTKKAKFGFNTTFAEIFK